MLIGFQRILEDEIECVGCYAAKRRWAGVQGSGSGAAVVAGHRGSCCSNKKNTVQTAVRGVIQHSLTRQLLAAACCPTDSLA